MSKHDKQEASNGGLKGPQGRYTHLKNSLGIELFEKVQKCKLLVVGAGGIGCELLKNLVLSGFQDIEIIDLDTIDLSNLNRQFLFQKKHIGMPKSQVAKESAARFNPHAKILAHFANIKNAEFGPDFFRRFDLVMNALDNLDARRHVNRLCIATEKPLIESGTSGYLGQVQVIKKGATECYECQPKPTPTTYAYCTIRSSPSKPIHCIIWSKEEFKTNFGDPDAVISEDEEAQDDPEIKKQEAFLEQMKKKEPFSKYLFHKLFFFDVYKKVRVAEITKKDVWSGRAPPKPLSLADAMKVQPSAGKEVSPNNPTEMLPDQVVWSIKQNTEKFISSVDRLRERFQKGFLDFDKDDNDALEFVTASSNLRSHIFDIPLMSKFSVKSLAGNIIPAIATTNAIIAGLMVTEAFKVLQHQLDHCRMVYLQKMPSRGRLLLSTRPEPQNPNCYVCSSKFLSLKIDTEKSTLDQLVNKVLKERLSMNEPSIIVNNDIMYECGEGLEDDEREHMNKQLKKLLKDVRITHNQLIEVGDQSQELKVQIGILHSTEFPENETFEILGKVDFKQSQAKVPVGKQEESKPAPKDSPDDVMIIEPPANLPANLKRKRTIEDTTDRDSKKVRQEPTPVDNIVIDLE